MLIPFGILSSAGAGVGEVGAYELIATSLITTNTPTVSFDVSSLASTYKHLQLRVVGRTDRSGQPGDVLTVRFNSDSGANYAYHELRGDTNVTRSAASSQTEIFVFRLAGPTNTANSFGAIIMDLLDPFAAKTKTVRVLSGMTGTINEIYLRSGLYNNTAAVTSIGLAQLGSNFVVGSRFSLYGIKG